MRRFKRRLFGFLVPPRSNGGDDEVLAGCQALRPAGEVALVQIGRRDMAGVVEAALAGQVALALVPLWFLLRFGLTMVSYGCGAPGSIFAYIAVTPKGGWFVVLLGVFLAAVVTFAAASLLLGFGRNEPPEDELDEAEVEREEAELDAARQQSADNKAASKLAPVNREATPREA